MRHKSILATLLFFVISATGAGATGPSISLGRLSHDFGDVGVNKVVSDQITVTNMGDTPLIVDQIHSSCACTSGVIANRVIEPGQQSEVTIMFNASGQGPGRKTHAILIHSNDLNNPMAQIQVSANVVQQVGLDPSTIIMTLAGFQEHIDFPVTARNNTRKPVTLVMSDFHGGASKVVLKPERVLAPSDSEARFQVGMDLVKPKQGNILTAGLSIAVDNVDANPLTLKCLIKFDRSE
jgi:hypothetical protein